MQLYNTKVVPSYSDVAWIKPVAPQMANARLLVITCPYSDGSKEEQTLIKMMAACKLSADEYAVLHFSNELPFSWQAIAGCGVPKAVLLLGVSPAQLSIHALFRLNRPNAFLDHQFIPAPSLTEIESNPAAKKDLWVNGLKPLFGL